MGVVIFLISIPPASLIGPEMAPDPSQTTQNPAPEIFSKLGKSPTNPWLRMKTTDTTHAPDLPT